MDKPKTQKQKLFCKYYREHGNKTKAARQAGYLHPEVLGQNVYKRFQGFLEKNIEDDFLNEAKAVGGTAEEVVEFLFNTMRGVITQTVDMPSIDKDGETAKVTLVLPVEVKDRISAARELGRKFGFGNKVEVELKGNAHLIGAGYAYELLNSLGLKVPEKK